MKIKENQFTMVATNIDGSADFDFLIDILMQIPD
jgi:hypothetical protein